MDTPIRARPRRPAAPRTWFAGSRLPFALLLAGVATASVAPLPQPLMTERRDAHVRDLTVCGRKKACLMRQRADLSHRDSAARAASTEGRSRWSEGQYDNVAVWIAPGEGTRGWRAANRYLARDAFHAWSEAGAPVHFVFIPDSARADVRVFWRDSLPEGRAGQTTRFVDRHGWLRGATIEMAVRGAGGAPARAATVRAIALHEVGHLLGLEHSADERDIMAAWVTARALTVRDLSAMWILYDVAPPPAEDGRVPYRVEATAAR